MRRSVVTHPAPTVSAPILAAREEDPTETTLDGRLVLLAGAMRCGTTSLFRWLDANPRIRGSRLKEPHHLGLGRAPSWTGPGDDTFAADIVTDRAEYLDLFGDPEPDDLLLDGSVMTMHLEDGPAALAAVPGSRAVVMLRDPVERARSAHGYQRAKGFEPVMDVATAIAEEERRLADGWAPIWSYLGASRYADAVGTLHGALGAHRVHVIVTEHLWARPGRVLDDLCRFLGVAPHEAELPNVNRGGESRAPWLVAAAYRVPPGIRARAGPGTRRLAHRVRDRLTVASEPVDERLRDMLGPLFSDDVSRLGELLGRDDLFDWWRSVPRP